MTDMYYGPLPLTVEDITLDFLSAALATRLPQSHLRSFKIVEVLQGTCTKIWLSLDGEADEKDTRLPETALLKGGFETHSRAMGHMHRTEALSYGTLVPTLGLRTPQVYFSGWDEAGRQGVVIMEDLRARGVDFCSPLVSQTFDQTAARLKALAAIHAQTWGSLDVKSGGRWEWLGDMPANWRLYFDAYLEPDVWNHYIREPRGAAAAKVFHDRAWMSDALDRMAAYAAGLPYCAIHGDTHLGNLYHDIDGAPGFFDCIMTSAPAMIEVAYHLGCALDLSDRAAWEADLIRMYLAELQAHGVAAPSFEEALHQYGVLLAYGYGIFIINEARFQTEANNTAYTARLSQAMLDHDTMGKLAKISL